MSARSMLRLPRLSGLVAYFAVCFKARHLPGRHRRPLSQPGSPPVILVSTKICQNAYKIDQISGYIKYDLDGFTQLLPPASCGSRAPAAGDVKLFKAPPGPGIARPHVVET